MIELENTLCMIKRVILSLDKGNITIHWKDKSIKWEVNLTDTTVSKLLRLDTLDKSATIRESE